MSEFKVGPAKTRDGRDAVVYMVCETHIHGCVDKMLYEWYPTGRCMATRETIADLMPPSMECWVLFYADSSPAVFMNEEDANDRASEYDKVKHFREVQSEL